MKNYQKVFFLIVVLILTLSACSENDAEKKDQKTVVESEQTEVITVNEGFDFFLPSPIQIAHILKKSGLLFDPELVNDPTKYDQYQTRTSGLLNLGVYTGDLAYCILNDRTEESLKYVEAIQKLASKHDLSDIYLYDDNPENLEIAISNRDSLVSFIIKTQENLNDYAYNSNQLSILLITFTGAWVETVYIGAFAENSSPEKITETLTEEMSILENLIQGLESFESENPEIMELVTQLKQFEQTVQLDDEGETKLSTDQIENLKTEIAIIRNDITNS
jgi:PBP1b-binding outer membrane lipoprotein LpoB